MQLGLTLFFAYTMTCFAKLAFPAVTAALVDEMILTKTQAGIIGGLFWLLYGIGQFFGGAISNRFSPYKLIYISMMGSGICNLLMSLVPYYIPMLIIWGINGMIQFGFWPSVLKLVSTSVLESQRPRLYNILAYGFCVGSILGQLTTAALLAFLPWNVMFLFCGVAVLLSTIPVVMIQRKTSGILDAPMLESAGGKKEKLPFRLVLESGFVLFAILICIKSFLDTGIKNWMPTILMETYNTSPSYSTLLSVVMMVVSLLGVSVGVKLYEKVGKNEAKLLVVLYASIVPLLLLLTNYRNMNIYITTILISVITIFLYGSGQSMLMIYPSRFDKFGLTAAVGGFMNCFAAFGNVMATSGNGIVADNFGWDASILVWNGLTILFVVLALILIPIWKKFLRKHA